MQPALWFALLIGLPLAGESACPKSPSATPSIAIVKFEPCLTIHRLTLRQVVEKGGNAVGKTEAAVASIEGGLPHVQKLSKSPILAATEASGWYFYATTVVQGDAGRPVSLLGGYAVKKDSREVIEWGEK